MLKVDYCLKTQKGNRLDEHRPRPELNQVNGNILLVQGPSSTGKSTVMNMIALGSYGEFNKDLSDSVITDLKELSSASYRDLEFDIELSDEITKTSLSMSKKSGKKDIKVVETRDGKESYLSQDSFEKKYRLVYDVPENPTKRLEQIRDTIKIDDRDASRKISKFLDYATGVRSKILEVPSDDDLKQYKTDYAKEIKEINALEDRIKELEMKNKLTECAILCKKYENITDEIDSCKKILEKELMKPEEGHTGEDEKDVALKEFARNLEKVTISGQLRGSIIRSRNTDLKNKLKNLDTINLESDYYLITDYKNIVEQMLKAIPDESSKSEKEKKQLNDLIKVLEKCDSEMSLGDLGSVKNVLDSIQKFKESKPSDEYDYSTIRTGLKTILTQSKKLEQISNRIQNAETAPSTPVRNKYLVESYREKIKIKEAERSVIVDKMRLYSISTDDCENQFQIICGKLNITITTKEYELEEIKNSYSKECDAKESALIKSKRYAENLKTQIDTYDGVEKPPHFEDKNRLTKIIDACGKIRSHIQSADTRLLKIELHDDSEYKKNPELYQSIWDYIGYKLGTIRDCGNVYNVKSVNLLEEGKGDIETDDGTIIHIGAMGTGEGQLSYLRGLLSSDDDRMLIVLFDEVGNMSNDLIDMLSKELKNLQKEGKLMLAFMARPTVDQFEVKIFD